MQVSLWVDQSYPYLMIFSGDSLPDFNRRSLAVEPMTEAILIALKVGERMVEPRRADPPRMLKIVFRTLHVFRSDGKAALVGSLDGSPRNTQHQVVDRFGPKR
jgi:hypothetical protein